MHPVKQTRDSIRAQLSRLYIPYFDALCEELPPDQWAPYNGLRSFELQSALYAAGRTKPGAIVTNAPPGASAHNYGMASDWAPILKGQISWPDAKDPLWQAYGAAVKKVGLRWGGDFHKFIDCPHNELPILTPWSKLIPVHDSKGLSGVEALLETELAPR